MSNVATIEHLPQAAPASNALTPYDMLSRAVESGAGIEVVSRLLDLHERWETNRARKAFDAALSDAKAEIPPIIKNRRVNFGGRNGGSSTDYRHEDLAEVARTVDPILAKYGLSYRFKTEQDGKSVRVTCIIAHRDGHSETNSLTAGEDNTGNKNNIQAIGSVVTYLQRYTLKAALGLAASNDDDGRAPATPEPEPELISSEQLIALNNALAKKKPGGAERLCRHYNVEALPDLTVMQFHKAMNGVSKWEDAGAETGHD